MSAEVRPGFPAVRVIDLEGKTVDPFEHCGRRGLVLIFVSVECPISNSYVPEYGRLQEEFSPKGFAFRLAYPNADESEAAIRQHLRAYKCSIPVLRDPRHELARAAKVRVIPEAAIFVPGHGLVYHGRIDDRHVEPGKARASATTHDLRDALKAILGGELPKAPSPPAVGCYIAGEP